MVLAEKKVLIHFGKTDPQGFLYHARLSEMAHELLEEFWAQHSLGWKFWFQNTDWAVPLRRSECEFLAPLRAGDNCWVSLTVQNTSSSTVTFRTEFRNPSITSGENLCAIATTVHVFVDRKSFQKIDVPAAVKAALKLS